MGHMGDMVALCVFAVPWVLVRLCNQAKTRRQLVGTLASGMRWLYPVRWTWYAASLCSSVVGCEAVIARSLGCPFPWLYVSPLRCLCSVCATPVLATLSVQRWLLSVVVLLRASTKLYARCTCVPPYSWVFVCSCPLLLRCCCCLPEHDWGMTSSTWWLARQGMRAPAVPTTP
jgi:hypothetical protein